MAAPVAYFEILSTDPERSTRFYTELFGWTAQDSGQPGYSLIDTGAGEQGIGGGIGAVPSPDAPGGTTVYVRVDDLQAYLDRAERLGGRTLVPPMALPGDYGTIAVFADPDGHPVGLWA